MAVSLVKGQKISLEKSSGGELKKLCVGVNWGAIEKKSFFGGTKFESVDLDASLAVYDQNGNSLSVVYFGNKSAPGIRHSGDDLTGDMGEDDGLDNEIITVDLDKVDSKAEQIVFVLNSFRGHDFKDIPFARIRIYEGTPDRVDSIFATYDIANDGKFAGSVSMVMGKLYKHNGGWKFAAIGETTNDRRLEGTLETVKSQHL